MKSVRLEVGRCQFAQLVPLGWASISSIIMQYTLIAIAQWLLLLRLPLQAVLILGILWSTEIIGRQT